MGKLLFVAVVATFSMSVLAQDVIRGNGKVISIMDNLNNEKMGNGRVIVADEDKESFKEVIKMTNVSLNSYDKYDVSTGNYVEAKELIGMNGTYAVKYRTGDIVTTRNFIKTLERDDLDFYINKNGEIIVIYKD